MKYHIENLRNSEVFKKCSFGVNLSNILASNDECFHFAGGTKITPIFQVNTNFNLDINNKLSFLSIDYKVQNANELIVNYFRYFDFNELNIILGLGYRGDKTIISTRDIILLSGLMWSKLSLNISYDINLNMEQITRYYGSFEITASYNFWNDGPIFKSIMPHLRHKSIKCAAFQN